MYGGIDMKTEKKYTATLMIKLPKEMKQEFEKRASDKYKSTSELMRDLIRKELEEN